MTEKERRYYMYTLVENLYQVYSYQIADTPRPFLSVVEWQQPISSMSGLEETDQDLAAGPPQG